MSRSSRPKLTRALLACFFVVCALQVPAMSSALLGATLITLQNPSFESPVVGAWGNDIDNWTRDGDGSGVLHQSKPNGDGNQVVYLQAYGANTISQAVGDIGNAACTYDLRAGFGLFANEEGRGASNGGTACLALISGPSILAKLPIRSVDLVSAELKYYDLKVTVPPHSHWFGKPLAVMIGAMGDASSSTPYSFAVDNVQLAVGADDGVSPVAALPSAGAPVPSADPLGRQLVKTYVLDPSSYRHYVDSFNASDDELYGGAFRNAQAWEFISRNIPFFDSPDTDVNETYYFRWWTYRKHLGQIPDGTWVVSEFLPDVGWAGKYNTIDCAAGHHIREGRWLHDAEFMDDYCKFWLSPNGDPRRYSFWIADSVYQQCLVTGDRSLAVGLLNGLVGNYRAWEASNRDPNCLFWQVDDRDGMEVSIGGSGYRATINSYMYGDAVAIAKIAAWAGNAGVVAEFNGKANALRDLMNGKLWDKSAQFYKVLPREAGASLVSVRELHGYTPWYFDIPPVDYSAAWTQLMEPQGFLAPYGPTTAEQRDAHFALSYSGHECQWNGPSWPFSTSVTLVAMANLLDDYHQNVVSSTDYFKILKIYADSQRLKKDDGSVVPWIDEDVNPDTGDWIARTIQKKSGNWNPHERGKDYNHSEFCDLVISGLVGLRPRPDNTVDLHPLVPPNTWPWFCLDGVLYHGHTLTIVWDQTGKHYSHGKGLQVLEDGKVIAKRLDLGPITGKL